MQPVKVNLKYQHFYLENSVNPCSNDIKPEGVWKIINIYSALCTNTPVLHYIKTIFDFYQKLVTHHSSPPIYE